MFEVFDLLQPFFCRFFRSIRAELSAGCFREDDIFSVDLFNHKESKVSLG